VVEEVNATPVKAGERDRPAPSAAVIVNGMGLAQGADAEKVDAPRWLNFPLP